MIKNKQKELKIKRWVNKWVIVCTDETKRGVFYGKLVEYNREKDYVVLESARMILYWCAEVRGVLGLAKVGAISGCRVSSTVPRIELTSISAIIGTTPKAQKTFEKEIIWS